MVKLFGITLGFALATHGIEDDATILGWQFISDGGWLILWQLSQALLLAGIFTYYWPWRRAN